MSIEAGGNRPEVSERATLVGALSALPGGLGSFEVVMVLLLSQLGAPLAAATLPVVVFRLCTLWLGCVIGSSFRAGWLYLARPKLVTAAKRA